MKKIWPYLFLASFAAGNVLAETSRTEENKEKIQVWTDKKPAASATKQKAAPKNIGDIVDEKQEYLELGESLGDPQSLDLTMGDKYLGQKRYEIIFVNYEEESPEDIEIKLVYEIGKQGKRKAKIGQDTKRKLEFACSLVSYVRCYINEEKDFSEILDSKINEYSNEINSLQSDANLAGTLEELGERAGYNFATGQPVDSSLLGDAVKSYAVKTVSDMITDYSIGANTSSDRTMSEILKTLADTWLSGNSAPENSEEEFTRDLRASFLVQAASGKKYLEEIKAILEDKMSFWNPTDYKEIEYFYSKFRDGWTKGGVLKGWRKLEDENLDRQVGKGIGKALSGKYLPNEAKKILGGYNSIVSLGNSISKVFGSEEDKLAKRNEQLRRFLENENIKQIFNIIMIETQEAESFFDNFEKYR